MMDAYFVDRLSCDEVYDYLDELADAATASRPAPPPEPEPELAATVETRAATLRESKKAPGGQPGRDPFEGDPDGVAWRAKWGDTIAKVLEPYHLKGRAV